MSLEMAVALVGFAFVMSISPGPSNFLLLASGVNFGFMRSVPLVFGICAGFLTMVFCVGVGLGQVLKTVPGLYTALKFACAAYVLWLAWKVARSRAIGPANEEAIEKPITFLQAALFQLVNPKAWAVALVVTVSYTDQQNYIPSLLAMIVLFAVINLPSISVWALSGVALGRLLGEGNRIAVFNIAMALLLVGSMAVVLFRA
ncbi:LysE family translocator [Hoeflea sp. TYP-13]|uniref:LysE family translocator n=1 Tax=Hoeflea sp. TYP-13 TaxID=3230023 RepID=UPI0034C6B193